MSTLTVMQPLILSLMLWIAICFLLGLTPGLAQDTDCSTLYPWVEPAVRLYSQRAWKSARASGQTTEEGLKALKGVRWGEHHPGMDQITLKANSAGGVDMSQEQVSKPNQPYKPVGMIKVLRRAVDRHQRELYLLLKDKPELKFIIETEDFPIAWSGHNWKLPAFAMCADSQHSDIPVPDFTFEDYPETRYTNTSFWAIKDLVLLKGNMVPWERRRRNVFMRHFGGVGYRQTLLPVLMEHQANGTDDHHLGVKADVMDTGFVTSNQHVFIWLDQWCSYRYLLHTAGFAYSAGLKYKLACGSVVIMFESDFREFYYPALKAGEHYLSLPEGDHEALHKKLFPEIKKAVRSMEDTHHNAPPPMADAARAFIRDQLTPDSVSCYWLKAIIAYSRIYYTPRTPKGNLVPDLTFDLT